MAQQIASLYANLSLNSAAFISGLDRATKSTDRASRAIEQGMNRASLAVKGFAGVLAADKLVDGAKKYLELADASKKMEAQTRLATATFGNQGIAMRDVRDIAKETRSGISEISDLYAKFMPTSKELGRSQADNARAVETFSKALKVGGADTNAVQSATLQMGQALASTNVQWEELGQILDASPRLVRVFTDSLGVGRAELKKMASEGKLTSKMLYDALVDTKMTSQIDAEFKELPVTFEQSKVLMQNSLMELVASFDQGAGISDAIVDAMGDGNSAMEDLNRAAEDAGVEIRANFEGLNNVFDPLGDHAANIFDFIRKDADYTRQTIGNLLRFIDNAHNLYADADNFGTRIENGIKRVINRAQDRAGGKDMPHFQETPLIQQWHMGDDYDAGYNRSKVQSARDKLIRSIRTNGGKEYRNFNGKGLTDVQLQGVGNKIASDIRAGRTVEHGTGKAPPKARDEKAEKAAARAAKQREREAARAQKQAEREAEEQRRNHEAFKADKNRSEREELDSKAALATVGKERFDFERQQLEQDRKSRMDQIDKDGPGGSKRYTEAQVAELKAIEEKITANRRQKINLDEAAFNQEEQLKLTNAGLANAQEMAQLDANMARTAKDRRAAEYRLLDLRMQQEKLALEAIIANRDSTEAEKEIARRRLAMLPKLRSGEAKAIDQQTMGPMAAYLNSIPRGADEINEALEGVEVQGLQGLQSGLLDAIKGVHSLGDAFSGMADTVIDGLLNIALQQMLIKPLGSLLFGGSEGGGGGLFGALVGGISKAVGGKGVTGKANGGMGNRGRYLVGEHGPEHVDIGGPFHVTPNSKLDSVRGGGKPAMNITFGSITSNDPAAVKAMATQAIAEMMPMINQNAANHTLSKLQRPRM